MPYFGNVEKGMIQNRKESHRTLRVCGHDRVEHALGLKQLTLTEGKQVSDESNGGREDRPGTFPGES